LSFIIAAASCQAGFGAVLLGPTVNPANGHSYFIIDGASGWDDAEASAIALGGHLATISTAEESAFVGSLLDSLALDWAWIGLNRASSPSFEWVDGEPVSFTNWFPGEPNNASGYEYYGIIYGTAADSSGPGHFGRWNDAPGNFTDRAVVEVVADSDGDGIPDSLETGTGVYVSPTDTGTGPTNADTDGDGLNDGQEVNTYYSNPNIKDTDGDGFDDGFEVTTGFSPTSALSTPDALSSIRTAAEYRFNAANGISYRIESSTDLATWSTIETPIIGNGGVVTRFYSIEGQAKRFFRSRRN